MILRCQPSSVGSSVTFTASVYARLRHRYGSVPDGTTVVGTLRAANGVGALAVATPTGFPFHQAVTAAMPLFRRQSAALSQAVKSLSTLALGRM
jgi:hypothetical protein